MAEHDHDDGNAMGGGPGGLGSDGSGGLNGGQTGSESGPGEGTDDNHAAGSPDDGQDMEESVRQSPLQEHMNFKTSFGLDDGRPTTWTGSPDYRAVSMPGGGYYSPSDSEVGARTTPGTFGSSQTGFTPPNAYGISWTPTGAVNAPAGFTPSFNRYGDLPTNWTGTPDFRAISMPGGGYYSPSATQHEQSLFSGAKDYLSKSPLNLLNSLSVMAQKPDLLGYMRSINPLKVIGGVGDLTALYNMYKTASTTPAHTTAKGFEIINDLSEVQTRPKTPEEVKREAAAYGLFSGVLATALRGPGAGIVVANAVDSIAQNILDGTTTYKDNYLTREDWDRVEGHTSHSFP